MISMVSERTTAEIQRFLLPVGTGASSENDGITRKIVAFLPCRILRVLPEPHEGCIWGDPEKLKWNLSQHPGL
jgi:hypothetical protein